MRRLSIILTVMAFAVLYMTAPMPASAASNSLGVNPRRDYAIKPGEAVQDILNVTNLHKSEDLFITIRPLDFRAANETGSPDLLLRQTEPTRWSLKPYITIPKTYTVPAGKSVDVPFSINIPANLGAGSYYSAIQYAVTSPESGEDTVNLNLSGSSVSLIFVRVPGDAKSSLQLKMFGAFNPSKDMSTGTYANFYGATKPKYLSYTLKNNGNIAEQPVGSIQLKNIFGKQVKLYEDVNPDKSLVLIEQTRRVDFCMNETTIKEESKVTGQEEEVKRCDDMALTPGRYTAKMSLLYGGEGFPSQEILATASFWYLPAWFIIAVLVALAVVAYIIWKVINKAKNFRKPTYGTRRR